VLRWLRNSFLYGVVVAAPTGITIWLVWTFVTFVDSLIRPLIPARYNPETYLPFAIPGIGLIIAIALLTVLGALAANIFGRTLIGLGERIMNAVPLVRNLYGALKQLVETALAGSNTAFKEVVMVEYPTEGTWAVAFVASHAKGAIRANAAKQEGEEVLGVFVPTTPNPTSGFLLFVPRSKTIKLDISIEEAAKLIISFGLVSPERLPEAPSPSGPLADDPKETGAGDLPATEASETR
jgi:uncharacterized membrane protein